MNLVPNYIFIGSRGIAKSSVTLLFSCQRAILYPGQKILVVCPVKSQSKQFIKKIYEYIKQSKSLADEIDIPNIKTGINECRIPFKNNSEIVTAVYSENSLGELILLFFVILLNPIIKGRTYNERVYRYRKRIY